MMKATVIAFSLLIFGGAAGTAQTHAGEGASRESRFIVDMPTAGVLPKLSHVIDTYVFPQGGIMLEWSLAPFHDLNIGIAFSGAGIIGNGDITWQGFPGLHARYRIINETFGFPALVVGFSSQGRGSYDRELERFETQSPGLYAALSKSFVFLGNLDFHAGLNYSFEPDPSDRSINPYCGLEKSIGRIVSVSAEYNSTLFGNYSQILTERGLLNAALRCALGEGFTIEIQVRDLLRNIRSAEEPARTLMIEFVGSLGD